MPVQRQHVGHLLFRRKNQNPRTSEKGLPAIARHPKMEQPAHDAGLSKERTALMAKRSAKELLALRSDSFMTPMPDGVGKGVEEGVSPSGGEVAPKKHLAFEEELPRDSEGVLDRHDSSASEKAGTPRDKEKDALEPKKKAPSARTTATKVSPSLISKIENNESGCDLKITSLVPFDHLSQLCQALSKNTSTERLDLEGCGVGDKGCLLIRDLLINNKVIKHVDLQMNQVTDVGCRYLAEILPRNTTLHKLYLGYNDIRDDGVYALIGAMRPRGQLEVVVSGNTHVSEAALSRLDRALEQQWRSAPKQFKELKKELSVITGDSMVESPPPRTSARREERERNGEADEGVEAKRARRNDKIAMGRQETKYTLTLEEDVIRGPPFEFKLVSTVHHAETKALSPTQGGETGTTAKAQHDDDGQSRTVAANVACRTQRQPLELLAARDGVALDERPDEINDDEHLQPAAPHTRTPVSMVSHAHVVNAIPGTRAVQAGPSTWSSACPGKAPCQSNPAATAHTQGQHTTAPTHQSGSTTQVRTSRLALHLLSHAISDWYPMPNTLAVPPWLHDMTRHGTATAPVTTQQ